MIKLNGRNILIGGFHDHWVRADNGNPTLLLAALNYYHYDFCVLMDGPAACERWRQAARAYTAGLQIHTGREENFGWGHLVTVEPTGNASTAGDPDVESVLTRFNRTCAMVIMAHPVYPTTREQLLNTGRLDELIDAGFVHGIELTVAGFESGHSLNADLVRWYRQRERAGRRTPIVGGWDVHLVKTVSNPPPVLYTNQRPPDGHYETACSNRTLVLAEENTLDAIKEAIVDCRSVIEEMPSGTLVGPSELVAFLEESGYHEAMAQMDAKRDAVRVEVEEPWIAGQPASLRVSQAGTLRLPVDFQTAREVRTDTDQPTRLPAVPLLLERDAGYLPVAWRGDDGAERIVGIETRHPIQLDILSWRDETRRGVEIIPRLPFRGTIELQIESLGINIKQPLEARTLIELDAAKLSDLPVPYRLTATNGAGIQRHYEGFLLFVGVWRFSGDWSAVPRVGVDRTQFAPRFGYGAERPYPGPNVYSAQLQFAWDEQAFRMRATVRDDVHYQPFKGHFTYNADCLQLAIDPMLRRQKSLGNFYSFNLALTGDGPELFRVHSPEHEASDSFTPPPANESLGDRYLAITPCEGGLIYEMTLPWRELQPVRPEPGHRMGVYYIMFNNNGTGHLDTMHWPVPIRGMWMVPEKWGVLTLLDAEPAPQPKTEEMAAGHLEPA